MTQYKNGVEELRIASIENNKKIQQMCETEKQPICDELDMYDLPTYSFYSLYENGQEAFLDIINEFIIIAMLILFTTNLITKYMKNAIIKVELTRKKYKNILIDLSKKIMTISLIPVLAILFIYFFSYLYTGSLSYNIQDIKSLFIGDILAEKRYIFLIINIINTFINALIITGITAIVCRKEHNFILASIKSIITVIGIELFLEIIVSSLLFNIIFKVDYGILFNIISIMTYDTTYGVYPKIIVNLNIAIVVFITLYLLYKNKEQLMQDCEKNL